MQVKIFKIKNSEVTHKSIKFSPLKYFWLYNICLSYATRNMEIGISTSKNNSCIDENSLKDM